MTTKTQIMTGVTSTASSSCFSGPSSRLCFMYLLERQAGQGVPRGRHCFWGCRHREGQAEGQRTWPPSRPTVCMRVPDGGPCPQDLTGGRRELWSSQGGLPEVGLWHLGQAVAVLWEEGCGSNGAALALAPPQLSHRLPWAAAFPCPARPEPRGPLSGSPGCHAAFL